MLLLFLTSYEKNIFSSVKIKHGLGNRCIFSPDKICGNPEPPMLPMFRTLLQMTGLNPTQHII